MLVAVLVAVGVWVLVGVGVGVGLGSQISSISVSSNKLAQYDVWDIAPFEYNSPNAVVPAIWYWEKTRPDDE